MHTQALPYRLAVWLGPEIYVSLSVSIFACRWMVRDWWNIQRSLGRFFPVLHVIQKHYVTPENHGFAFAREKNAGFILI